MNTHSYILLDSSGSMLADRATTLDAVNEYMTSLPKGARVTICAFDTDMAGALRYQTLRNKVKRSETLTPGDYNPSGMTPLYDAILRAVKHLDVDPDNAKARVSLVIVTDGLENFSREGTKEGVRSLLKQRQEESDWLVLYLGADHDAFAEAGKIGIDLGHTVTYTKSKTRETLRATSRMATMHASGIVGMSLNYTDEEREDAKE